MAKGLRKMISQTMEWPPSAMSFRALCLPDASDYSMVSEEVGFQMAVGNRTDKTAEVVECLRRMGGEAYQMKREPEQKALRRWGKWYSQLLEDVAHGFEIPELEKQIEEKTIKAPKNSKKVKQSLAAMKSLFEEDEQAEN